MMGKTYYCGEKMCSSDMMPLKIVKINGSRLPQKELFQKMNDAFDGKIGVLQVTWHNGIKWLCTQGWQNEAMWWKLDNKGRVFTRNSIGWEEILE